MIKAQNDKGARRTSWLSSEETSQTGGANRDLLVLREGERGRRKGKETGGGGGGGRGREGDGRGRRRGRGREGRGRRQEGEGWTRGLLL